MPETHPAIPKTTPPKLLTAWKAKQPALADCFDATFKILRANQMGSSRHSRSSIGMPSPVHQEKHQACLALQL